jgi:hypothetical protein
VAADKLSRVFGLVFHGSVAVRAVADATGGLRAIVVVETAGVQGEHVGYRAEA